MDNRHLGRRRIGQNSEHARVSGLSFDHMKRILLTAVLGIAFAALPGVAVTVAPAAHANPSCYNWDPGMGMTIEQYNNMCDGISSRSDEGCYDTMVIHCDANTGPDGGYRTDNS